MKTKFMQRSALRWSIAIVLTVVLIAASFITAAANAENVVATADQAIVASEAPMVARSCDVTLENEKTFEVTVDNCGKMHRLAVSKGTVGEILDSLEIKVADTQAVVPSTNTMISEQTVIYIFNCVSVELISNGVAMNIRIPEGTVESSLEIAGFDVDEDDVLSVDRAAVVEEGMQITLKKVEYKEVTSAEKINFNTINKESDEMDYGDTKVTREGVEGEKEVTRKLKYVDGKLEANEVVSEKVTKKAVDEVVVVGTKRPTLNTGSGSPVSYSYVVTGSGTAYTSEPGALTATGVPAYQGGVAVNPNVIPYGSQLYIESVDGSYVYGYATAVDTGGALMDGSAIVDLYYYTYDECIQFGRRDVNVYVLG